MKSSSFLQTPGAKEPSTDGAEKIKPELQEIEVTSLGGIKHLRRGDMIVDN